MSLPCLTAGQRVASRDLRAAVAARKPIVLLFGDSGSGKSIVIDCLIETIDAKRTQALRLSATGSDFLGPPTFETLLEAICQRLSVSAPSEGRPASLAGLSAAVGAIAQAGMTVVMVIDHADRLSDEVIVEVARLHKYLDVPPDAVIRVFVGSLDLASRIDMVLRRIGADQRLADIRLSQPTAEDVATILAYDDSARSGGPMLTAQAIERISAYAKSNLHWAVPMADAARSLAEMEGAREVTPELVREALLDIWSPEHEAPDDPAIPPARFGLGAGVPGVAGSQPSSGLSDSMGFPAIITEPAPRANSSRPASAARDEATPAKAAVRSRLALKSGAAVAALLAGLGAAVLLLGRHEADMAQHGAGSTAASGESPQNGPTPEPSLLDPQPVSTSAVAKEQPSAAGTALDGQLQRTDGPRRGSDATQPVGEPSMTTGEGGAESGDIVGVPTASAPPTVSADTLPQPDASATKPDALPKQKPPVTPTPKRPGEKTAQPWVQVR